MALAEHGIAIGIHNPVPIHLQPAYAWLGYSLGAFPVAERWACQCLSLLVSAEYAELTAGQIERILAAVQWLISRAGPAKAFLSQWAHVLPLLKQVAHVQSRWHGRTLYAVQCAQLVRPYRSSAGTS